MGRDWTILLTPIELAVIPANFNALVEDIVNQAHIGAAKTGLDTLITQVAAMPPTQQTVAIQALKGTKIT